MRLIFTFFSVLLVATMADAQKITGIWRGYFTSSPIVRDGFGEERYKYEIQIEQKANNSVGGVTYSYKTTVFYGKAELTGILTLPAKTLILRETKLLDLKISDKSEPCLMTCYLDYTRIGKLEVLEGTFISTNMKDKRDCGSGKVYLEKVTESDFKKEDFLVKKGTIKAPAPQPKSDKPIARNNTSPNTRQNPGNRSTNPVTRVNPGNPAPHPGTEKPVEAAPVVPKKEETVITTVPKIDAQPRKLPVPRILQDRENNLVKTLTVNEPDLTIELYDNGTIDNDTITVFHNNQVVLSKARLGYTPLTVKLHCTEEDSRHELIMVAENLGEIPPNTALMVIKYGRQRQEIFLAANEQRNAKVIIQYVPKQ